MASRFRLALAVVVGLLGLAVTGCGDAFNAGPVRYAISGRLDKELKGKPKLRRAVLKALADLYGESPRVIKVPKGSGLPYGGRRLAGAIREGSGPQAALKPIKLPRLDPDTWKPVVDAAGKPEVVNAEGGYTLYRRHCLHCHGVSGDGDGPTADFLYPRPRDYRKGVFKFTSTATGAKPSRDDLLKTIRQGLHGTSMPAFDSLMTPEEIEQVTDYVILLSVRGETEQALIDEAGLADENDPDPLPREAVEGIAQNVFQKWASAEAQVLNPPAPRTATSAESVARGRELFLGRTKDKLECWGCHGPKAQGNGPSFVDQALFDMIVFNPDSAGITDWQSPKATAIIEEMIRRRYNQLEDAAEAAHAHAHGHESAASEPAIEPFESFRKKTLAIWKDGSFDDWGQPLRPANLNRGTYKGGRRPVDIYWRIAKGINGAKMPAHGSALKPEQIWDLVNFVLALPYEPELLRNAVAPGPPPALKPTVAQN